MRPEAFSLNGKPALCWGRPGRRGYLYLHGQGGDKAEAAARGHGAIDPWPVPASAVRGLESTTWYLDRDAAGELAA